jgi:putative membrane protein
MVIPGVSGSMIMMLLGYYNPVINAMNDLRGGDWSSLAILLPYAIGLIVGIVVIAKLMNYLLKKHAALTFCAIFGLVIGSPVTLLMQNRECFPLATIGIWIACAVCLVVGFAIAWFMSVLDRKQSEN